MHNFESPAERRANPRIQKTKPYFDPPENDEIASTPPTREGLPPSYKMRADPHYVDLLAARTSSGRERVLSVHTIDAPPLTDPSSVTALVESIKRHGVLQPLLVQEKDGGHRLISGRKRLAAAIAAGFREVPCMVYDVDDAEAAKLAYAANRTTKAAAAAAKPAVSETTLHAGTDLSQSLATLGACADLLSGSQSELSRAVVGNLIRAEVWRASCLLQATRVIRQEMTVAKSATSVLGILDRVEQAFLPERQVRALVLTTTSQVPHGAFIAADERVLTNALSGAVLATLSLLQGAKDARLTISATGEPVGHVTFSVSQDIASVPEIWATRAFDPAGQIARRRSRDRPDGRRSADGGHARRFRRGRRRQPRHPHQHHRPDGSLALRHARHWSGAADNPLRPADGVS